MATLGSVYKGINILADYEDHDESVSAGHDRLYVAGPPPEDLPDAVASRLDDLGWIWDEKFECWLMFT